LVTTFRTAGLVTVEALLLAAVSLNWISPALFTALVIVFMLMVLIKESYSTELTVMGSLVIILVGSKLSTNFLLPKDAFAGFGNEALITIAALFVVARAVRMTGIFNVVAEWTMGANSSSRQAVLRLSMPLMSLSAFFNNTPIVSIFLPIVRDWSIKRGISPSKLLIPLSYLTSFGGLCTLIGTSTHLVIRGMADADGVKSMEMFDLAWIGVPMAFAGVLYLVLVAEKLLPNNLDLLNNPEMSVKKFMFEMAVKPNSSIVGKNLVEAGLRNLNACFIFEVRRGEQVIGPVKGTHVLQAGDILVFSGSSDAALNLHYRDDLEVMHEAFDFKISKYSRLLEVMISPTSSLVGKSLNEVYFNRTYNASVLALHRHGKRLSGSIGQLQLEMGDTLLLLADVGFRRIWQDSPEFMMVSPLRQDLHQRQNLPLCVSIIAIMVILPAFELIPILYSALLAAFMLVWLRVLDAKQVLPSIEWSVLITIGASLGLGQALTRSGASQVLADYVVWASGFAGPLGTMLLIYLVTNVMTELITNSAAAALVYPVAIKSAVVLGVRPTPFIIALAIAASASFSTPIGYQTNMLVYGPGGYRFKDFLKVGLPLNILYAIGCLIIIPMIFKF